MGRSGGMDRQIWTGEKGEHGARATARRSVGGEKAKERGEEENREDGGAWAKRAQERSYIDFREVHDDVTQGGEVERRQTRRGDGSTDMANGRARRGQARPGPFREGRPGARRARAGCSRVLTVRTFTF
ncbi:hypothetical protein PAAG_12676 [Paracoccidioides lutzii Pb01]|uniref:Uncharacterized protein n=1 Tax=Paracoccidioides lutzii (strain ATCC MYA-826 / Pb01) TaxID=502779 RepID=A0A0A2UYN8_PARBA|nr:hypothetical protein PAAG_12676 [Paracoccidioides lutzii Pb01]KGQ00666.1 hypothetical protein PAAG_12676 [Paracoccidioides lutzii Pb01]